MATTHDRLTQDIVGKLWISPVRDGAHLLVVFEDGQGNGPGAGDPGGMALGWALQDCGDLPKGDSKGVSRILSEQAKEARARNDRALLEAPAISDLEAKKLQSCRRRLTDSESAALNHHLLCQQWGTTQPTQALLEADRDGLREKLRPPAERLKALAALLQC